MKKILLSLLIILLVITGYGYYRFLYVPPLPAEAGAKATDFSWQYKGVTYKLSDTLYQSIDDYYGKRQKGIYQGFETRSIEKYLEITFKDDEVAELVTEIRAEAAKKKLTEDQTLELAVSFIQTIPYDEERARTDLTHPRYPYEVLFEGRGICSDKTLLALAVLRQMGYGTATFMYDEEQHMAAAVLCPSEYSNYDSGYCIVETTATGNKIGVIPELESGNLKAVGRSAISSFDSQTSGTDTTKLSKVDIYATTTGKIYKGIAETIKIEKEIESIKLSLAQEKIAIEQNQKKLETMKRELDRLYAKKDYTAYNALVSSYNALVGTVKKQINDYNTKVKRYNYLIVQ